MRKNIFILLVVGIFLLSLEMAAANNYTADVYFRIVPDSFFVINERIELKGQIYLGNYSNNGSLVTYSALANSSVNLTIKNSTNSFINNYSLTTDDNGTFYSKSNYYTSATEINASSLAGDYEIRVEHIDPNNQTWFSEIGIKVVNQSIDILKVSSGKARYYPLESVLVEVEATKQAGESIYYRSGVSVNGTLRDSSDAAVSRFNCTTGSTGRCIINLTAPSAYSSYTIELDNFKATGSFDVIPFYFNIYMKDELGKSFKNIYALGGQARIEVQIANASDSDIYTFSGYILDSNGAVVKSIDSTVLNNNNSFTNSFLFTVDSLTFNYGSHIAKITLAKQGDGSVNSSVVFEVRDWSIFVNKKSSNSGFEYGYSVFPNGTTYFEAYPKYRANGSVIPNINTSFFTISIKDNLGNTISSTNVVWNSSCGSEGCYEFNLNAPLNTGKYKLSVSLSYNGDVQAPEITIGVVDGVMSAQSTNKEGALKELFGTNEYAYISLTAYNPTSSSFNLSDAEIFIVSYMNGSEFSYANVSNFDLVNSNNSAYEWAWNSTLQRIKLDVPKIGGIYEIYLLGNNRTMGAISKIIVNPYDVCSVPKNTPGQAGGSTGYYYVWQFKTSDTVYFELKAIQANNPLGKASVSNMSGNSSGGKGSACTVSSTQQVVSNATVSILEVKNAESGALQNLNTTESTCQTGDSSGGYTCTIKPLTKWEGGGNIVKFNIQGQDGTVDIAYSRFEARAFYLYGYSQQWQNSPSNNITLTVQMYEAGNGWWGSSSSLSGTVSVKKIEYQGRDGEWLPTPVDSGYNVSNLNSTSITGYSSSISLPVSNIPAGAWKTGYYRVILQATTSTGDTDYGYAWFGVKLWDVYGTPIECTSSSCQYKSYFNSRDNITLYTTINKAGAYWWSGNTGGEAIGGNVTIGIKKIQNCRTWPCKDLNLTEYSANTINVNQSSPGYWYSGVNLSSISRYIIQINKTSGSWGTGYYSVVLDVNGTDTGYAWFNTIAFYVDARPTDINGTNYKYSIKPGEDMYFNVTSTRNYKGWGVSYNVSDFVNTTLDDAVLRAWNQTSWQMIEYNYPEDINITPSSLNGSTLLNVSFNNGSWPTGYYWGELTLRNSANETSSGWLWFEAKPFRVYAQTNIYDIDSEQCVNATFSIYEPNWYSNTPLYGNYSVISVYENIWSGYGSSQVTYTNYTSSSFNATASILFCPNSSGWGSGSWGGYHYLNVLVRDNSNNDTETGWLYFRAVPFRVQFGSVTGGNTKLTTGRLVIPATVTKYSTGENTTGNLTAVYQWRWDESYQGRQNYVFSVGSCFSNVSGKCTVNGTQNVTIYPPVNGWRIGYNNLYAEWTKQTDASSKVESSGIYIDAREAYSGYFASSDRYGSWKYDFSQTDNLTIKIYTQNLSSGSVNVNITNIYYAAPSSTCYDEWCRSYTSATWSLVGGGNQTSNGNAIINIIVSSGGWSTKGIYYIKARVSGSDGIGSITGGSLRVKDSNAPNITIISPINNQTITGTTFTFSANTTKNSQCSLTFVNYNHFNNWYCPALNSTNSTNTTSQALAACNTTLYGYNGSEYYYESISENYYSATNGTRWRSPSSSTVLTTGGTFHSFTFNTTNKLTGDTLTAQHYGIVIWCSDEDNNYKNEIVAFKINVTNASSSQNDTTPPIVTIVSPANTNYSVSSVNVSFALNENGTCLYSLNNGTTNFTMSVNSTGNGFNATNSSIADGSYTVRAYCNDTAGNKNYTATKTFLIDTIYPLISYETGTPGDYANLTQNSIYVNVSVTETNFKNITFILRNSTSQVNSTTFTSLIKSVNWTSLPYTDYIFNVSIYDSAGHFNSTATRYVNLSSNASTPINVTLVYPTNTSTLTSSSFTLNYTVNIQANCSQYWNASGWSLNSNVINSGDISVGASGVSNGLYIWNVYCVDIYNTSNNVWGSNYNWTFRVNASQAPINVTLVYPTNASIISTSNFTFNYSVNIQANCSHYWNINGNWSIESNAIASGDASLDATEISNGVYIWNVYCVDIYNTSNNVWGSNYNWTFRVNASQAPINVTLFYPAEGATINASNFTLNYSVNIEANCTLYWNVSGNWSANQSIVDSLNNSFDAENINDGGYKWNIYCSDAYNTSNSKWAVNTNRTFTIDTAYPLISYETGTPGDYANLTQNSIYVNVSVTETNFKNITFILRNSTSQVNSTTFTSLVKNINWTNLPYTNYTFNVSIYDTASNFNSTATRNVNLTSS